MMSCEAAQQWLDAFIDGELDPIHSLEMQRHVETCAACGKSYEAQCALVTAIGASLRYAPPDDLRARIAGALQTETGVVIPSNPPFVEVLRAEWSRVVQTLSTLWTPRPAWGRLGALALTLFLFCAVPAATWVVARRGDPAAARDLLVREMIDSHVRSLMVSHLADVVSSDRHTVKPWFNGKLDFSPTVIDFDTQGFPLVGGRLDYLDEQAYAALVYRRDQHIINLFVRPVPAAAADSTTETLTRQGYHLRHWTRGGMSYWVVSDLNEGELEQFSDLVRRSTPN